MQRDPVVQWPNEPEYSRPIGSRRSDRGVALTAILQHESEGKDHSRQVIVVSGGGFYIGTVV